MMKRGYAADPRQVYTLELEKLQRCFSRVQEVGENASEARVIGWRQVEHLRQLNWLLEEALMAGDKLIEISR